MISFDGYDNDPREIYDIPEIRNWVSRLFKIKPHLFYYLSNVDDFYMYFMYKCLLPYSPDRLNPLKNILLPNKDLVERIMRNSCTYSKKVKDSIDIQYQVADEILNALNYDDFK